MSVGLLDVNMLVALAWPSHVHHETAHAWFSKNHDSGWATCPHTQCSFVRVSSNPRIVADAVTPIEATALLRDIVAIRGHVFWPDDIAVPDALFPGIPVTGHRQVVDAYLLALAIHHGGRLVTLDRGLAALAPAKSLRANALDILSIEDF